VEGNFTKSVVKTLVGMIEPFKGLIYDTGCGSGGIFVQSEKFVEKNQGKLSYYSVNLENCSYC